MKPISKHFGYSPLATSLFLSGFSTSALNEAGRMTQVITAKTPEIGESYVSVMTSMKTDPKILAAFETIKGHRDQNNLDMVELAEIPAPPFGEETRAKRVAKLYR